MAPEIASSPPQLVELNDALKASRLAIIRETRLDEIWADAEFESDPRSRHHHTLGPGMHDVDVVGLGSIRVLESVVGFDRACSPLFTVERKTVADVGQDPGEPGLQGCIPGSLLGKAISEQQKETQALQSRPGVGKASVGRGVT